MLLSVFHSSICMVAIVIIQPCLAYYYGRHVCTERKEVKHPVPVTKTYRKAVFRKDLGKVVYVTAHRTVFEMKMKVHLYRKCCKGWGKRVPMEAGCLVPECKEKCQNGGHCIAPDVCNCADGYTGHLCEIDINECAGRHQCHQKCINLPGTYECACQKGFQLSYDEMSCDLCLTCTKEFKDMQEQLGSMREKIVVLEEDKKSLENNLTEAFTKYERAIAKMENMDTSAQHLVTPPQTTAPHDVIKEAMPLDRLASMSQQISLLEERMADCSCNGNDYY